MMIKRKDIFVYICPMFQVILNIGGVFPIKKFAKLRYCCDIINTRKYLIIGGLCIKVKNIKKNKVVTKKVLTRTLINDIIIS